MNIKAFLFGNLTIDHNITESGKYIGPGGSVYFIAKTFKNLGIDPTVVSPYGKDFPKKYLLKTVFLPAKPNLSQTLVFENIINLTGKRIQRAKNYQRLNISAKYWQKKRENDVEIVIVAPILPNISSKAIKSITQDYSPSLKLLLPQGFYRKITSDGKIEKKKWPQAEQIIPLFNIIVVSDQDFSKSGEIARNWSQKGPVVIITREDKGCDLYQNGEKINIPAFKAGRIIDSTGAGDIFAAAFAFAYLKNRNVIVAAHFANAAACLSLRCFPNKLQYGYKDIIYFAQRQERQINL